MTIGIGTDSSAMCANLYNRIIKYRPCDIYVGGHRIIRMEHIAQDGIVRLFTSEDVDGKGPGYYILTFDECRWGGWTGTSARKDLERRGFAFDSETGLYSRNGITGMTEEEVAYICDIFGSTINTTYWSGVASETTIRTTPSVLSRTGRSAGVQILAEGAFHNCSKLEVVNFDSFKWPGSNYLIISRGSMMFSGCSKLREVTDRLLFASGAVAQNIFNGCGNLETIYLYKLNMNVSIPDSPLLKLEALRYMVTNSGKNDTAITVTLHPTVYAKLTDQETHPEWYAVNMEAQTRNIAFATI